MYSSGIAGQNYLRGVQVTDANGEVTFTTIFPGCYPGRWPHMHFEIYRSLRARDIGHECRSRIAASRCRRACCSTVYTQSQLYPGSTQNLSQITLNSDNVSGNDGGVLQIATTTGDNTNGYAATLEVGVAIEGNDVIYADGFE